MIELTLDPDSGVAPYRQIAEQVRAGIRLGELAPGERLPTADEVVEQLGINHNTVIKAYRELRYDGLVTPCPGHGTFVMPTVEVHAATGRLRDRFARCIEAARNEGLDDGSIRALVYRTMSVR